MRRFAAILAVAMSVLAVRSTAGQTAEQTLSFEVASIKPNNTGPLTGGSISTPGRFRAVNQTLKALISLAYDLRDFQILGGPDWINSERYDIDAKGSPEWETLHAQNRVPRPDPVAMERETQILTGMLQQLLSDRFQLKSHMERRELPIYELTLAKSGMKLQVSSQPEGITPDDPALKDPNPAMPVRGGAWNRFGLLAGSSVDISFLVAGLSQQLKTPIVNKTGLSGFFSYKLTWTPDQIKDRPAPEVGSAVLVNGIAVDPNGPSLFTAIQEQLGLRLDSAKGPVAVLVIDSVQKPTAN